MGVHDTVAAGRCEGLQLAARVAVGEGHGAHRDLQLGVAMGAAAYLPGDDSNLGQLVVVGELGLNCAALDWARTEVPIDGQAGRLLRFDNAEDAHPAVQGRPLGWVSQQSIDRCSARAASALLYRDLTGQGQKRADMHPKHRWFGCCKIRTARRQHLEVMARNRKFWHTKVPRSYQTSEM